MEIYSPLHFNSLFILLFSSFIVVTRQWRNKKQIRFPPSGPWRLLIIGSLHHLIGRGLPHHILRSSAEKYGPRYVLSTRGSSCGAAFGKICKDRNEFITIVKGVLSFIGGFDVADTFPSWKLLHNISAGKKANGEFGDEDLIDVLLRVKENAELQFPVINDHIKAVLLDIFLAGTETSSATIIWALAEMIKNPNVLAKAQSEVRQVFKGKKKYDEEDLEKLTYLNLVVKEALRLHPRVPLIGPRECREQADINGYTIPLKTRVLINAWALARDPGCWDDPESFMPERFENSSIDFTGNYFEFIPFGAGRRICQGMSFGLANVTHALAQLLFTLTGSSLMELIQKTWI
ncbi:hypothetical protein P3S67_010495 [Capsicum chacoense]